MHIWDELYPYGLFLGSLTVACRSRTGPHFSSKRKSLCFGGRSHANTETLIMEHQWKGAENNEQDGAI